MHDLCQAQEQDVTGVAHWTHKGDVRLFLWEKYIGQPSDDQGTLVFVHGSSMASQPTFDLHVEGRPFSSVMNWFAVRGCATWCVDMEGYGRSDAALFAQRHPGMVRRLALDAMVWTGEGKPSDPMLVWYGLDV